MLAYRSRIHSSTGFTPFEVLFGRKMHWFNAPDKQTSGTEEDQLHNRSRELKQLIETTRAETLVSIEKEQLATVKQRNKKNADKIEVLQPGTYVYKEVPGLLGKLQARYVGPYKIEGRTKLGNYNLVTKSGARLKESTPISKLKKCIISNADEYEVEAILKHAKDPSGFRYLVKWKGYDAAQNSWIQEEDFVSPDFVRDYWRKL